MLAGVIFSFVFFVITGAAMGAAGGFLLSLTHAPEKTGELAHQTVKNH
jgi:hypothetical protein